MDEAKGISAALEDQASVDPAQARKMRRVVLVSMGLAIGAAASKPGRPVATNAALRERLIGLARSRGIAATQVTVLSTSGGSLYRAAIKTAEIDRKVAIVVDRQASHGDYPGPIVKLLIAYITANRIVGAEFVESR